MLSIIGLVFLYLDIYLSSVDIIADAVGLFLLAIAFLLYGKRKACSPLWALAALLGAAASALSWFSLNGWVWSLASWLLPPVLSFLLVRRLYALACEKACGVYRNPPEPEYLLYFRRLVDTALVFILLCELCAPLLALIPVLPYLLLIARTAAGLFVIVRVYKMLYWTSYSSDGRKG